MVTLCLTVWGTANYFPKWLHHFIFSPAVYEGSNFSTSSPALVVLCLFYYSHLNRCEVVSVVVLICISLMAKHLFACLLGVRILQRTVYSYSLLYLLIGSFILLLSLRILYLHTYMPGACRLSDIRLAKHFPICWLPFCVPGGILWSTKVLINDDVHFICSFPSLLILLVSLLRLHCLIQVP